MNICKFIDNLIMDNQNQLKTLFETLKNVLEDVEIKFIPSEETNIELKNINKYSNNK
jgi:hypothetical protein